MSRMATSTPARMIGSPLRAMRRVSAADKPCSLVVVTSRPVSTRPQVAALTNSDGLWPRCARQFVSDQGVAGSGVGNAQQRLGEAHQRHALLTGERIFVDQAVDAARAR